SSLRRGLILSVLLHSLPLLALIGWEPTPEDVPKPIPIELVMEQPPPPPVPEPPAELLPSRRASADLAEAAAPKAEPGSDSSLEASAKPEQTAPPQNTAAASSPPSEPAAPEAQ